MRSPLRFRHGVHPPEHKELTAHLAVRMILDLLGAARLE